MTLKLKKDLLYNLLQEKQTKKRKILVGGNNKYKKNNIENRMKNLGYKEYINCYLVQNNIRETFLFQYIDYKEFN